MPRTLALALLLGLFGAEALADPPPPPARAAGHDAPPPPARAAGRDDDDHDDPPPPARRATSDDDQRPSPPARAARPDMPRPAPPPPVVPLRHAPPHAGPAPVPAPVVAEASASVSLGIVEQGTEPAPPAVAAAPAPSRRRIDWIPAPQPTFGELEASFDLSGGLMTAPDGTPLSGGGWELGASGGWGPTRFAELRLRASFFDQPDRTHDANGDSKDDVDDRNLLGMFLGGGLRLRLPLYTGTDARSSTRFAFFSEGLVGLQPLFSYGSVVSSGPAFELTNGLQISTVRRRDGLTRGLELFVRYRTGLGDGNDGLHAVLFGLGYATEWSAFVPTVPPSEVIVAGPPARPLGFSLRMGGECAGGQGWHAAKTVGWAPLRFLELQLRTSYFSIDHSTDQEVRDEPNVQGLFAGAGPRFHLYADAGLRLGLWASATFGWAQVVSRPETRDDGSGLALNVAVGASFGASSYPHSAGDFSAFVARQTGIGGNDDDIGMLYGGIAFDYELGPHVPPPDPVPVPVPVYEPVPEPVSEPVGEPVPVPAHAPAPVRTRTEIVIEPLRPSRPWPVGFNVGVEVGWTYFARHVGGGFLDTGLDLALGAGFVASPYFEIHSRAGLLTRSDASENDGDDIEAVTLAAGPRVRIPIRTVKDNQVAVLLDAMAGWAGTVDAAGSALGSGAILEGGIGVRLPARAGVTVGVRGLWGLSDDVRDLTSVAFTFGGELEMGPRFRRPVELPEVPRVEVPSRVEVEVR